MTLYEILDDAETRSAGITNLAAFILKETGDEANPLSEHPTKEQIDHANKIIEAYDRISGVSLMFMSIADDLQKQVAEAVMMTLPTKE